MKTLRLKFPGLIGRIALLILVQLMCYQLVRAQSLVTGVVKDETGATMPSVTVQVKGKGLTTVTDLNGKFTINAAASDILQFRFVGYVLKEVPVGTQSTLDISLEPDSKGLSEVA